MKAGRVLCVCVLLIMFPYIGHTKGITDETDLNAPERERIYISLQMADSVQEIELETYIIGVLLAEIPADFDNEALKAQAVASRTFALKTITDGNKHGAKTVCSNPACCQGWIADSEYILQFGNEYDIDKIQLAIERTASEVLSYEGELIAATYFSSSGGFTEDAVTVWGQDYPYLKSVPSPEGELDEPDETKAYSKATLEKLLKIELEEDSTKWFTDWKYTSGQGVEQVTVGGVPFKGTLLRSVLSLRSTAFRVTTEQDIAYFHTKGYGHRVGLSQYGAQLLAISGKSYKDILTYYYPGTEVVLIENL